MALRQSQGYLKKNAIFNTVYYDIALKITILSHSSRNVFVFHFRPLNNLIIVSKS